MRRAVAGLVVAAPFALGWHAVAAEPGGGREVVARFADPAINESSGLVVVDGQWVTVNDSGDEGRLFVVDPATGETVRTVWFADDPVDVEALTPAGDGAVWVGDIGDNTARRDSVQLYRVPLDGGAVTRTDLVYPGGPRDAEALLAHPETGELVVVSKEIFGGTAYAVPDEAGQGPRKLRRLGEVSGMTTDGAFSADGSAVVLRSYTAANVYTWPDLAWHARIDLPSQQQGEGLAVDTDGSLLLTSEGLHAPVLRVRDVPLPEPPPEPTPEPSATTPGATGTRPAPAGDPAGGSSWWPWALGAVALLGAGLAGGVALRRRG